MGLGACCTHYVPLPPLDAIAGWQSSRELGHGQCHIGFGNHLPVKPPPIANGVAGLACDMGAGDTPAGGTVGLAHQQATTKRVLLKQESIHPGWEC